MEHDRNAERRLAPPRGKRCFGTGVKGAASPLPAVREAACQRVPPKRRLALGDNAGVERAKTRLQQPNKGMIMDDITGRILYAYE
jgi:hypothetical protein